MTFLAGCVYKNINKNNFFFLSFASVVREKGGPSRQSKTKGESFKGVVYDCNICMSQIKKYC